MAGPAGVVVSLSPAMIAEDGPRARHVYTSIDGRSVHSNIIKMDSHVCVCIYI